MMAPAERKSLEESLSGFADRLFHTGGHAAEGGLADVPPERFEIYRTLVRGNYASMLRFALTQSCRLLDQLAGSHGLPADLEAVIERFLELSPAHTHSTREMCDLFIPFLQREYADAFAARPELSGLLTLERAELRAYYSEDDPGRPLTDDELETLRAGSVDAFLALEVVRAPSSTFLRFDRPISDLYRDLRLDGTPGPLGLRMESVTLSRHPRTLMPVVVEHPRTAGNLHVLLDRGASATFEELAARWLADLPAELAEASDEERFGAFAQAALGALEIGFFRAAN